MIRDLTGAEIAWLPNPRNEPAENELVVKNEHLLDLGLQPTTLKEGLLEELVDVAKKYAHRIDRGRIVSTAAWSKERAERLANSNGDTIA